MLNKFEIHTPRIFPKDKICSGVTKKNSQLFPPNGFSVSNGEIFTDEEIKAHRKFLADFLNVPLDVMKFQHQVHKTNIMEVGFDSSEEDSDGMITNQKGLVLNVKIADCIAVLLYDSVNDALGALHSGWRGSAANIIEKGIYSMRAKYGSEPSNLLAYIAPSASGNRYEVGKEVALQFPGFTSETGNGKFLLDLKSCSVSQLLACGLNETNIEVAPICTISDPDYHSFRRDKSQSGRMCAYIMMI